VAGIDLRRWRVPAKQQRSRPPQVVGVVFDADVDVIVVDGSEPVPVHHLLALRLRRCSDGPGSSTDGRQVHSGWNLGQVGLLLGTLKPKCWS